MDIDTSKGLRYFLSSKGINQQSDKDEVERLKILYWKVYDRNRKRSDRRKYVKVGFSKQEYKSFKSRADNGKKGVATFLHEIAMNFILEKPVIDDKERYKLIAQIFELKIHETIREGVDQHTIHLMKDLKSLILECLSST
jgi:hypothetical protein